MMIGMFVRDHAPLTIRHRTKQRMIRSFAVTWSSPDPLEQLQKRRTLLFKRCRSAGLQLVRRRRALWKREHVQDEMLKWKVLEGAFVRGGHRQFSKRHERRQVKMLQHTRYIHATPSP